MSPPRWPVPIVTLSLSQLRVWGLLLPWQEGINPPGEVRQSWPSAMETPMAFCPASHGDELGWQRLGVTHEHAALCHVFPVYLLPKAVPGEV